MAKGNLFRNTAVVGAFTMLSRLLGLVREMLQSRLVGAGVEQSAFALAFAVPNMARKLFGEGALTAAFVPVFRSEVEHVGVARAAGLARAVMTTVWLVLGAVVAVALGALAGTLAVRGPSLAPRTALTLQLVEILVPYMLAICGAAFGMGVLNALGRFKAASFMPALLNVVWIATLGGLAFFPGWTPAVRVRVVAGAILLGGLAQLVFMLVCMARAGVRPGLDFRAWGDAKVRLVWRNLGIAAAGAGAVQVNYMLDQVLAQLASPWAAGVIGYAERLMDLPLGVVGVAFGTVLLPTFAGFFAQDDAQAAREALGASLRGMLFVMLPAAAGLCVLAPEVTGVIYEGGSFDAVATVRVARALAVYAGGLAFFGVQKTLVPWFHAQSDMRTPLRVSLYAVLANAALNVLAVACLPVEWRHVGLAASTALCAAGSCALLVRFGRRRNGHLGLTASLVYGLRTLAASGAMAGALVWTRPWLAADVFSAWLPPAPASVVSLGVRVALGAAFYGALAVPLGLFHGIALRPRRRFGNGKG